MSASRWGVLAAVATVVAWGLKAVAIGVAGGLDRSPLEGPLYVLGLVAIVVAFASLGVAVAGDRSVTFKVIGAIVGRSDRLRAFDAGLGHRRGSDPRFCGSVQAEAGLWFSALLALGVTAFWHTTRGAGRTV